LANGVRRWYLPKRVTGGKLVPLLGSDGTFIDGPECEHQAMQAWHEYMTIQNAPTAGDENPLSLVLDLYLQHLRDSKASAKTLKDSSGP
jgi:hypothetical protein